MPMVKRSKYSAKTLRFTVVNHSKFTVGNLSKFLAEYIYIYVYVMDRHDAILLYVFY